MKPSIYRANLIKQARKEGKPYKEISSAVGVSESRCRSIHAVTRRAEWHTLMFTDTDRQFLRDIVATYTILGVLRELTQIVFNYGQVAPRYRTLGISLNLALARLSKWKD